MSSVIVKNDRYTVEPLYQWDVNQDLEIYGLSLPSVPEIHFVNEAMDRAIVRQATMDDAGVITVGVPNSLLQKPYAITAYICTREGDTFKSLYAVVIPVKARKKPSDYTLENDDEVYSFNALENKVNNAVAEYEEINAKYNEALRLATESDNALKEAVENAEQAKENYTAAVTAYREATSMVENSEGVLTELSLKANKATISATTLSASGWSGNTYSFESEYPVANYDIEIALNSTATVEQAEAFNSAQIVGNATSNIVKAFGEVPTVDIPIIIKAVRK